MKILMVIPKFILAGAETMCENLSVSLARDGHQVSIVSLYTYRSPITERLEANGIRIFYLDKKPGLDVSMWPKLRKIIRAEKPDVLHSHLYVTKYSIPASAGTHVRRIHTMHSVAAEENQTMGGVFLNRLFFRLFRMTTVALSERIRDTITEVYHLPSDQVPIVGNGIPLERCLPKTEWNSGIRLLHAGRMMPEKNQTELLKAVRTVHDGHPDLTLTFLGEGELRDVLKQQAAADSMTSYVDFAGLTDQVSRYMHDADIFLLPSLYEGMPMTLLEAMGTGLPILTTPVGGIPDLITDGRSGIFCGTDAASIAAGLERLISDPALRKTLGTGALEASRRYSADAMAAAYLKIYTAGN